eukprot:CAMPEP_0117763716 /NCGR_PEP_ID=MMETSP0947-20121206/18862_1 /TAXON_ID=44440 /ORGANISM="Chattonella subsalsa, Strain CCMP2191" /LENGTH=473 /DNA_ID=CAMNT_0005585593 /DNA_START=135 /DNA_END=1556 /DNA_ORIENTATION=+
MNRQKSAEEENDGSRGRSLLQKLSPRSLKSDSMSKKRSGSLSSTGSSRSERARSLSQSLSPRRALKGKKFDEKTPDEQDLHVSDAAMLAKLPALKKRIEKGLTFINEIIQSERARSCSRSLSPRRALKGKSFEEKNPDEQDLHVSDAAMLAKLPALKKRIEKGFDIHKKDKYGRSVLIYPVLRGQLEVTEYLIKEQNMDPNALCNKGRNALHWLATSGSPNSVRIFRLLHEKGVEINRQDEDGNTPLMIALFETLKSVKFIQALCFHGAKKNFKNKEGKNAVQAAHEACGPVWALEVQKLLKHRPPGEALKAKKRIVKVPPVEETKDATTEQPVEETKDATRERRISGLLDEEQAKLARTGSQVSLESLSVVEEKDEDDLNQEEKSNLCKLKGDYVEDQEENPIPVHSTSSYSYNWDDDDFDYDSDGIYYDQGAPRTASFIEFLCICFRPDVGVKRCPCCNGVQRPPPGIFSG